MSDVYLWDTYEKVGREALERRDFGQAIESFRSAVAVAEKLQGEDLRLVMSLRHLSGATAKAGQLSLAYDLLGRTEEIAVSRLGGAHSETVQVKRDLYDLSRQLGHLDQAENYLVEVLAVVRSHGETEEFLEILELLAQLAGERERLDNAATLYKEIVEARATLYGEDHPSVAQALLWHSTALSRSGQGEAAEAPLARAFSMLERQFADDPKSLAQSLLAGAELMTSGGRPKAALEHQKRALDLLSGTLEEGHQTLWDTREMIASTLASLGRLEEAIELLEFCLQHRQGRDHRTGGILKNLAGLYLSLQRVDRAEGLYSQATDLLHKTLGPDHPASLATLEERIQLYHFTGRPQEALDLALTTIRPTEQRYGAGHPNTAQVYASTAVLAHAARKWDTAYELMKAAEAIWETLTPRPADVLSNCRLNMATCLVELGRNAEAALALKKVTVAPGNPLEKVVRELWSRLEVMSAASPQPAQRSEEGPALGEPRRSIKLGLAPKAEPTQPSPALVSEPAELASGPVLVSEPAAPVAGSETVFQPAMPSAAEMAPSEVNPFDDIKLTELDGDDLLKITQAPTSPAGDPVSETQPQAPDAVAGGPVQESESVPAVAIGTVDGPLGDDQFFSAPRASAQDDDIFSLPPVMDASPASEQPFSEAPSQTESVASEYGRPPVAEPVLWDDPRQSPPLRPTEEFLRDNLVSESPRDDLFDFPDHPVEHHQHEAVAEVSSGLVGESFPEPADFLEFDSPALSPDLPSSELEPAVEPASTSAVEADAEPTSTSAVEAASEVVSESPLDQAPGADDSGELSPPIPQDQPSEPQHADAAPGDSSTDLPTEEPPPATETAYSGEEGDDRRSARRFNLGLNRFFDLAVLNDRGELSVIRSFLVDLSAGGLRVNSERPLPLKETFQLTLPPELLNEEMVLPARVTWQRPLFGATFIQGVEFLALTDQQRTRIEAVLAEGDLSEKGRQHYRLYRPFPIQVCHREHTEWLNSYASDLSVEGLGTRLETDLRAGESVRLRLAPEFELPAVEVVATVAWSRSGSNGFSHGLRFDDVGPVEARTIALYIERCLELSPD
jgi:tetratricopeptide (TPR) repeat protein